MMTYLSRLVGERDSLTGAATELAERAANEERDLTSTEHDSLASWQTRCAEIDSQLTEYSAQADSARAYASLRQSLETREADPPPASSHGGGLQTREAWGDLFIASEAFRDYPGAGSSRRVELPFDLETRAAIALGGAGGLAGAVPPYLYTPAAYQYASPLLDVCGKVTTSANSVHWVQWAPNPQAAASVVAEGTPKPEAAMTPTVVPGILETYAHWKGITRQALEDIPQIRSTVENRLRQGLVVALEGAVATALGAAPIPAATVPLGGTLLEAIRVGVATVQGAGYGNPNAVLLNPADWADLDVSTIGNAGGANGQTSFWGMQAIAVPELAAGTAYVGNFSTAVQLFTRSAAEVFMTDSHGDLFISNIILLLAEIRALATVPDPGAAAECSVAAAAGRSGS